MYSILQRIGPDASGSLPNPMIREVFGDAIYLQNFPLPSSNFQL